MVAVLVLKFGRSVSVEELTDAIWGGSPPARPRRVINLYATRIRAALGGGQFGSVLETRTDGYAIAVATERVDLGRFEYWREEARRAAAQGDLDKEETAVGEALAQWRGVPLSDVPSETLRREATPQLDEEWLQVLEQRIDVDLRRGRHGQLVGELATLTTQHPLRERFWAQMMSALYAGGRRAAALETYHTARRHLRDTLGADPGDELQALHMTLLTGGLHSGRSDSIGRPPVPRLLPADCAGFSGRVDELRRLSSLLPDDDHDATPQPSTVAVITGTAGVGKTTLAVHWARRSSESFPDGQLWVNLRGYDQRPAITPERALTLFLRALSVRDTDIPSDLEDQAALYRSLMDGRRVLVVLDNANSAEQVRPLLPGAAGCFVLVTSRNQLSGLIARGGAQPLVLGSLTVDESRELLARRVGRDRVAAEPDAVGEIIDMAAGLPLALAIVAARVALHARQPLSALAAKLHETRSLLDSFAADDPGTDTRTVLSWSYRTLTAKAARLFRLLGLHPGPDIDAHAAASLANDSLGDVQRLLLELTHAGLLEEHALGRYAFHDLLRAYANELANDHDSPTELNAATRRMIDHYLYTAHAGAAQLTPSLHLVLDPRPPDITSEVFTDRAEAWSWFLAEQSVLLAIVACAADKGFDRHVCHLAWAILPFLNRRGQWRDLYALQRVALQSAGRVTDLQARAIAYQTVGIAHGMAGHLGDAHSYLRVAANLFEEIGDHAGEIGALNNLAIACNKQELYAEALKHSQRALKLAEAIKSEADIPRCLNGVGWIRAHLGELQEALVNCRAAVAMYRRSADIFGEAAAIDSIGYIYYRLGKYQLATTYYRRAITMRGAEDRYNQAVSLQRLGDTHLAMKRPRQAHRAWQAALVILDETDHPDAGPLRAKAAALGLRPT